MGAHTPGPWVAHPDPSNNITGRDDWCIGVLSSAAPDAVAICSECDARLIAAAPDLLAALKECITAVDVTMYGMAIHNARAAIAKAKGEI